MCRYVGEVWEYVETGELVKDQRDADDSLLGDVWTVVPGPLPLERSEKQ